MEDLEKDSGSKPEENTELTVPETAEPSIEETAVRSEDENDMQEENSSPAIYRKGLRNGVLITLAIVVILWIIVILVMLHMGILTVTNRYRNVSQTTTTSADASGDTGEMSEEQLAKAELLFSMVQQYYNGDLSSDTMSDSIYHAILEGTGDQYTQYFSAEELQGFNSYTDNTYYGIGVTFYVDDDGKSLIKTVYEDSFAEEAGLLEGDKIIAIDGVSCIGWESADVKSAIQGEEGTTVVLTIERDDETMDVTVTRGEVTLPTVGYTVMDNIGYIQVVKFGDETADEFSEAVQAMKDENVEGVIIDLRDNTGGRVEAVVSMMDEVLGEGTTLTMEKTDGADQVYTSDEEHKLDVPIICVVNENSASASEIFAAAMKDFEVGAIVGTTTYGKGVYQNIFNLSDGSAVKITTGKFYSPKGNNFNGIGITPDYEVEYEYDEDAEVVYGYEVDSQLSKAFEVMHELIDEKSAQ